MADSSTPVEDEIIENPELVKEGQGGEPEGQLLEEGAEGAGSPPAEDENKPKSMLDAVTAALAPKEEQSSGSGEEEGATKVDPAKAAKAKPGEEELGEITDEELNALKPKTRRRFEMFRNQVKTLSAELEQFKAIGADPAAVKTEAEGFRSFLKIATEANLSKEEVNTGFNIMNLMKNNPAEAYKQLTPFYQQLQAMVGEVLPADLQQQVNTGEITLGHAKELSILRAATAQRDLQQTKEQASRAETQKREAAQKAEKLQTDVGTAVTEWEQRQKSIDPDYLLKQSRVVEAVELAIRRANKPVMSVEEAIKIAESVKKQVDEEFKKLIPRKKAAIVAVQGTGANNRSRPVPTSTMDAMRQALGQ